MAREEKPIRWKTLLVLLAVALALGSTARFTDLGKRPMHTDEAILALKTQEFWKTGTFEYDLRDYHGPFLHHLTKWIGSVQGWTPDALTEQQVRLITAIFGLLLVLTPLLFLDVIGRTGAGVAALLLAVSPMMAYYSRYYIMETPFVLLGALFIWLMWQWSKRKQKVWLLPAGIVLGLMHATKETFVLNVAALIAGCAVVKFMGLRFEVNQRGYGFRSFTRRPRPWGAWLLFTLGAVFSSTWMYSNGFHNWDHVVDSVRTYESYLGRSQGGGGHEKPWHYYLALLFWRREGFVWSQALICGLAIVGMLNSFLDRRRADHKRAFLVGFSTYAIVLLIIYSIIPYKTPWSVMSVVLAFALLAGLGTRAIFRVFTDVPLIKAVLALALAGGLVNLSQQTIFATDWKFVGENRYAASEQHNPYAYAHTVPNLVALAERIHELARKHPAKKAMPVQVIQKPDLGWPLPWYLRDMTHVGYQEDIPSNLKAAAVVVVDADREEQVLKQLGKDWSSSFWGLRAGVTLCLLVDPSLEAVRPKLARDDADAPPPQAASTSPSTDSTAAPAPAPAPETIGTPAPVPAPEPAAGSADASSSPATATATAPAPSMPAPGAAPLAAATAPAAKSGKGKGKAAAEPVIPKAQLVEDDPPLMGPPFPVPPPLLFPPSTSRTPQN